MPAVTSLQRVQASLRSGHKERPVRVVRQGDEAVVFTLPGGGRVEVLLTASGTGGLVLRAHGGTLERQDDGSLMAVGRAPVE